ncbi:MAG: hypothetical protein LBK68_06970 [Candidatus Margulisbacteria bacterium]|jgi:hypothetical protein|nr:hypothetical protein [Candidatus Margulisiibacteriota bacterium]
MGIIEAQCYESRKTIKCGKYFARSGRNLQCYAVSARAKIFATLKVNIFTALQQVYFREKWVYILVSEHINKEVVMGASDNIKKALVISLVTLAVSSLGLANDVTIELAQASELITPTIEIMV